MATIKPLDEETLLLSAGRSGRVVTLEDHAIHDGLGGAVAELLREVMPTPVKRLGVVGFGESGGAKGLYAEHGPRRRWHRQERAEVPEPLAKTARAPRDVRTTSPLRSPGTSTLYCSLVIGALRRRRYAGAWALPPQGYRPRQAEASVLHTVIREHLDDFLRAGADRADGAGLPEFIAREFREFLTCGVLGHGFARVRCERCALERLVPFSCKGRGFCPSCGGRRMTEGAAHFVDNVLPPVPVRQWVLTLPYRLR